MPRPTIRLRLTLMYAALFFVAGALLLTLMYGLLNNALQPPPKKLDDGKKVDTHLVGTAVSLPPLTTHDDGELPTTKDEYDKRIKEDRKRQRDEALHQVRQTAVVSLIATSIVALAFGWMFSGRMLRPIREITQHTRQLTETTLDQRLTLNGPNDELRELGSTINGMLERLEHAFDSQRRFAAQASHELRTPLAIIGAEADLALSNPDTPDDDLAMARAIRLQVTRSERLVNGLLVISRSESTMRDHVELDLADVAGDVLGEHIDEMDARHLYADVQLESAPMTGDPVLLRHLIGNMLANATRYNVDRGLVALRVGSVDGVAFVTVENTGVDLTTTQIDTLFTPFKRGLDAIARNEGGFGLGLAIINSVTQAHDGVIEARPRDGGGLVLTVRFPTCGSGS